MSKTQPASFIAHAIPATNKSWKGKRHPPWYLRPRSTAERRSKWSVKEHYVTLFRIRKKSFVSILHPRQHSRSLALYSSHQPCFVVLRSPSNHLATKCHPSCPESKVIFFNTNSKLPLSSHETNRPLIRSLQFQTWINNTSAVLQSLALSSCGWPHALLPPFLPLPPDRERLKETHTK